MNSCSSKKEKDASEQKPGIEKTAYGKLPDGQTADLFTLRNASGMTAQITNYGGIIVTLTAPDKNGKFEDVTLGQDSLSSYVKNNPFFGATELPKANSRWMENNTPCSSIILATICTAAK